MNNVKDYLIEKGISQRWLADQVGISTNAMNSICGGAGFRVSTFVKMCKVLDCTPYDLVDFEKEKPPPFTSDG